MKTRWPIGTFINMLTVTVGSLLGMGVKQIIPDDIQSIIFQAIGLGVLLIGIKMSLRVPKGYLLVFIFSLILGGVLGVVIQLEQGFYNFGEFTRNIFSFSEESFSEGLVTAFLVFCVGSMTIVGAIEEGLEGKRELLLIKSTLDGITAVAFASTYGIGVLFSIFPMLLVQGGITVLAIYLKRIFTTLIIDQLSAIGGILIVGIGINMLKLGEINIENLLPSLLVVFFLTKLKNRFQPVEM